MKMWEVTKETGRHDGDESGDRSLKILSFLLRVRVVVPLLLLAVGVDAYFMHIGYVELGEVFTTGSAFMRIIVCMLNVMLFIALMPYMMLLAGLISIKLNAERIVGVISLIPLIWMVGGIFLYVDVVDPIIRGKLESYYFAESHKRTGVVYGKYEPRKKKYRIALVGVSQGLVMEQKVLSKSFYDSINRGDTVIIRVSDKYPRYNVVLNWHPNWMEIEKYKTPVKLVERKE